MGLRPISHIITLSFTLPQKESGIQGVRLIKSTTLHTRNICAKIGMFEAS
jgi:hypothetical protein